MEPFLVMSDYVHVTKMKMSAIFTNNSLTYDSFINVRHNFLFSIVMFCHIKNSAELFMMIPDYILNTLKNSQWSPFLPKICKRHDSQYVPMF